MELVDVLDSKSSAARRAGSSPAIGTNIKIPEFSVPLPRLELRYSGIFVYIEKFWLLGIVVFMVNGLKIREFLVDNIADMAHFNEAFRLVPVDSIAVIDFDVRFAVHHPKVAEKRIQINVSVFAGLLFPRPPYF